MGDDMRTVGLTFIVTLMSRLSILIRYINCISLIHISRKDNSNSTVVVPQDVRDRIVISEAERIR